MTTSATPDPPAGERKFDVRSRWCFFIIGAVWLGHLVLLWGHRFVPSMDYPNWLLQADALSRLSEPSVARWYDLRSFLVPNGGFLLPASALARLFPVEIAGKIVLSVYIIWFPLAVRSFFRSTGNTSALWTLSIPLLFNAPFQNGNMAFLIGLCLLFQTLAFAERTRSAPSYRNEALLIFLTCLLFLTHALCSAAAFGYALLELMNRSSHARRRLAMACSMTAVAAGSVAVLRTTAGLPPLVGGYAVLTRIGLIGKSFGAGLAMPPFEFSVVRAVATFLMFALVAAIIVSAFRAAGRKFGSSPIPALSLLLAASVILVPRYIGGIWEPSARLAMIVALLAASLAVPDSSRRTPWTIALCIVAMTVFASRTIDYLNAGKTLASNADLLSADIPPGSVVLSLTDNGPARNASFLTFAHKEINLIFQADYLLFDGGFDPLSYRTGFLVPREDAPHPPPFHADEAGRAPEFSPDELSTGIDVIVLYSTTEWGDRMVGRLSSRFRVAGTREIAPSLRTIVLRKTAF